MSKYQMAILKNQRYSIPAGTPGITYLWATSPTRGEVWIFYSNGNSEGNVYVGREDLDLTIDIAEKFKAASLETKLKVIYNLFIHNLYGGL